MAKVSIEVPEGMTAEKLLDLLKSYETRQKTNKLQRENRQKAIKALIEKHPDEYKKLLAQFKPKA